ncbi:MAG: G5 domain-containing protein [Clostridiaceae bacterium]
MKTFMKVTAPILLSAPMILDVKRLNENLTNYVTVDVDGVKTEYKTLQTNVGAFLKEKGIELDVQDYLDKPFTTALNKEDSVKIKRKMEVAVTADGRTVTYITTGDTVRDLLAKEYINVGPMDKMSLSTETELTNGLALKIVRVTQNEEIKKTEIPFETVEELDKTLDKGIEKIGTEGVKGENTTVLKHTYEDGALVNTETLSDSVTKEPVNKVILIGDKPEYIFVRGQETNVSASKSGSYVNFTLSFYTDLPEENGGYSVTAMGDPLRYGCVASNVYPLGTKIYLEGWGSFFVGDRGGSDFYSGNRLDVFIPRNGGESNSQYRSRVLSMGKPTVGGYIN